MGRGEERKGWLLLSVEGGMKGTPSLLNSAFREKLQEIFLQGHRPVSAGKRGGLPTRMES